jgi:metal-responsive CopG/Arc/MetJ family transcriptional regulator
MSDPKKVQKPEKEKIKIQLSFPADIVRQIDEDVDITYTSRTVWFIQAALEKLEQSKRRKIKELIRK